MKVWKSVTEQISFGGMKNRAYKLSGNRPGIIIQQDRKAGDAIWFFTQHSSHAWYELWIVKDIIAFRTKQCKNKCIVLPRLKLHLFHLNHPNTYRLSALAAANWEPKQIAKWVRTSVKKMTQESWTKRTLTGQISLHISSHVLIGFREITWWMEGGGGIFEKKKVSKFHIVQFVYKSHKGLLLKGKMIQTTKSTACLICLSATHAESANWVKTNHKLKRIYKISILRKGM